MKRNDIAELHSKTVGELKKEIRDIRQQLVELAMDYSLGKETNTDKKKQLGKDLARTLTVLSEKGKNMVQSAPVAEQPVVKEDKKEKSAKKEEKEESSVTSKE